jgi:2-oxoglutarate/2-oxoacid ferredoxin oxidoreductase subunit beta
MQLISNNPIGSNRAILHQGPAFLDVISPCVAFNNHAGSTKSYEYVREHNDAVNRLDVIPTREEISVEYEPGETIEVAQHDGSTLRLHKLHAHYNPCDHIAALAASCERRGNDRPAVRRSGSSGLA